MSEYTTCERVKFDSGQTIDGKYIVDKLLGEGTFGCVYKVHDNKSVYALKLLKLWQVLRVEQPNLLKRFDREFETGKISSNYLVHTLSKGNVKGNPYIVMEFYPNGDLFSAIESNIQMDFISIAYDILYGLKDLHANGKIHRDLKPENVLLRQNGHVVLTDFGIAGDQNNRLTRRGILGTPLERFGTFAYMPPEQIDPPRNRNATVLATTDIFSFGVMMYQLLTKRLPFGPLEKEANLKPYTDNAKDGKWDRERLRSVAPEWCNVIEACLKPKIEDRAKDVDDVLALLPQSRNNNEYKSANNKVSYKYQKEIINGVLLRVMEGEEFGKIYRLGDLIASHSRVVTIGRIDSEVKNLVSIKEEESLYVSRFHCTIELDQSTRKWLIRDGQARVDCPIAKKSMEIFPCRTCSVLCPPIVSQRRRVQWRRSLNGTFVNSTEVDEKGLFLMPGDIISIGNVKLRVEGY